MAATYETLLIAQQLRRQLQQITDERTRTLVAAWVDAWDVIAAEVEAAVEQLLAVTPGAWPTPGQVRRATRAQRALTVAREQLEDLARTAQVTITGSLEQVVTDVVAGQPRLIRSQLPPGAEQRLGVSFDLVSQDAIDAIVKRSTRQITALTRPLSAEATRAMKQTLVRGVVVGENPRAAARTMLARTEGAFNGGLTRALVVSRTEMLDAHREGARAQQLANADVLQGWMWFAQLDQRTCPSCWGQHGSEHTLDEQGPNDHQQGRCVRLPITLSWRSLGFDLEEPPSLIPDARTQFDALPAGDQLAVMGPKRLAGLKDGSIDWSDLSAKRTTTGWRDSYAPTPVRDLVA